MRLTATPVTLRVANTFVGTLHRHHKPTVGHKFSVGARRGETLVGVVIVGRPVARHVDHATTAEVTHLCTDGSPQVCSFLYSRAARIAREMGYERIQTYILENEPGTSLKAAGWRFRGMTSGGSWHCESRPRTDKAPTCRKQRWAKELA